MISDKSVNFLKALEKKFSFLNAEEMAKEIEKNEDLKKLDEKISNLKAIKKYSKNKESKMLSSEQWQNLQQFSAIKEEKKENYKPYFCGILFLICYIIAQILRVIFLI